MWTVHTLCVCAGTVFSSYTLNYYDCERSKNELLDQIWLCIDTLLCTDVPFILSNKIKGKMLTANHPTIRNTNNKRNNQEENLFPTMRNNKGFIISRRTTCVSECIANDRQNRQITMEIVPRNGNCIHCLVLFCYFVSFFIIVLIFICFAAFSLVKEKWLSGQSTVDRFTIDYLGT